uniref:Uncharacterized protein n=1 Tax=Physcomitrium patens TaxID=3218 RepID=A0A2K1KC56_PHYPA|nr:hypothetical protein PHYPA_010535 [Physcomitrium patens]
MMARLNLDMQEIKSLWIWIIEACGFIEFYLYDIFIETTKHRSDCIEFHKIDIKSNTCLEDFIKVFDLIIKLVVIDMLSDYNTCPLNIIYNNFVDALLSYLYSMKNNETPCICDLIYKQRWSYACTKQLIERLIFVSKLENKIEI